MMSFLRFEEMGLLSIDDRIISSVMNVTWKQNFSSTAGINGNHTGKNFAYSNSLWPHVLDYVETLTGVSFAEAMMKTRHILLSQPEDFVDPIKTCY